MATEKKKRISRSKARKPKAATTEEAELTKADTGDPGLAAAASAPMLQPPAEEDRREQISEAVFGAATEAGLSTREALSVAESTCDRLRRAGLRQASTGELGNARLFDLRADQDYVYPGGKRKVHMRGRAPMMREPSSVTTIVIHQTAIEFGVSPRAISKAGGDVDLARARRALDVACHALAFRDGFFAAAHPLRTYVNHAGRFNAASLGLEIEGRYPGLMDDVSTVAREDLDSTWGGAPSELTPQTVDSACEALRWLVDEGRREGMPITRIVSHRQSSDHRRSDPGEEIWKRIVLDFAVPELGLVADLRSPWREGRPVPVEWDSNGIGSY